MQINTILFFFLLSLNVLTYGQKNPTIQNISSYIMTESDTIKIQRINQVERDKLFEIGSNSYPSSQLLLIAVLDIQDYLNHSSRGEKPNGYDYRYDSFEIRLEKLTKYAKEYGLYFDLENYKKENSYYVNFPLKNGVRKSLKEIFRKIDLENKIRIKNWAIQRKNDSLTAIKNRQKEIKDSIEYLKQRLINETKNKELQIKFAKNQFVQNKLNIEKKAKQKIEIAKKTAQRREEIISLYGQINGEAIMNHKVKIGWSKAMCIASWGKPWDINRTTTDYSDESEHPIPTKVDSRFDDDFLG